MSFSGVVGQDSAVTVLERSLAAHRVAHAYLFTGIEGCGKRTTALAFIEAIFCGRAEGCGSCPSCRKMASGQHPDLHLVEPDGAFIKIDQIRELQRQLALRPYEAPRKGCIIEAADRLHPAAANALLKTLEEPPGNAVLILLSPNPAGVLPTIISRCQQLRFASLPQETVERLVLAGGVEQEAARVAASLSEGSMAKALEIVNGAALEERARFIETVCSLSVNDAGRIFAFSEAFDKQKDKAAGMLDMLQSFLRDVLLRLGGSPEIVNCDLAPLVEQVAGHNSLDEVMGKIGTVTTMQQALQRNVNPRLAMETLVMRLANT
ncbi:MAG: DNA polymerase III subunit delta' [Geobacter sp.]|nr:DNA polymerase III subunit delta' [Geobacter sp.]